MIKGAQDWTWKGSRDQRHCRKHEEDWRQLQLPSSVRHPDKNIFIHMNHPSKLCQSSLFETRERKT
jgi:hypothetical protein